MSEPANTLAVKVLARYEHDGIIKPLRIICGRGKVRLNSWTNQGLSWYSGRAAYSRIFAIPDAYIRPDWKLMLELGEVRYCAEIWVNDQLVTYRSWPPFTADITPCVHVGKNRITIIVANLLANRRLWEIYDCNLTDLRSRFCHEGAVFRESDSLTSGLLGPVRIIPYHHETLEIAID